MKEEAGRLGLQHEEVLWAEPLKDRLHRFGIDDYLLEIAGKLQPGEEGAFGKFHAWEGEE